MQSDGSCLLHAISIAACGSELFYSALRRAVHTELRGNVAFYRDRSIESGFYTAEEWDQDLADAAAPVSLVASARWLSGMHIFATANVLRRPILLVDQRGVNGTLLFLPLRVGAAACRALSGQIRRGRWSHCCTAHLPC